MNRSILPLVAISTIILTTATGGYAGVASFQGLGDLPGGVFVSRAEATSADGSVVVGVGNSAASDKEAFRWTQATGMVGLGDLPGGDFYSEAFGTSADGSVVVGDSRSANSAAGQEAFRWTAGGGMVGLSDLPGASFQSRALATSADGSVVVGRGRSNFGEEAFRWTADGGMVGLGDLPGGNFESVAIATSADGEVIVGRGSSALGPKAFLWTASDGMRPLQDLLTADLGLDLTGWRLQTATGVSADGLTIVGFGISPNSTIEAYIVTLPEPGTLAVLGLGVPMLLRRGERRENILKQG